MIVRIFRARARPGRTAEFAEKARSLSFALMAKTPGLRAWFAGEPIDTGARDFVVVSVWDDLDALRAYAGDDWQRPQLPEAESELLEGIAVDHYTLHEGGLLPG